MPKKFFATMTTSKCRHGKNGYSDCDPCRIEMEIDHIFNDIKNHREWYEGLMFLLGIVLTVLMFHLWPK